MIAIYELSYTVFTKLLSKMFLFSILFFLLYKSVVSVSVPNDHIRATKTNGLYKSCQKLAGLIIINLMNHSNLLRNVIIGFSVSILPTHGFDFHVKQWRAQ